LRHRHPGKPARFRGHFFNWYDTGDLRPLEPKYVSSVDSGNLAGHLIALANACRESVDPAIANGHWIAGVEDALALARDALPSGPAQASVRKQLEAAFTLMDGALAAAAEPAGDLARQLATLALQADVAIDLAKKLPAGAARHPRRHADLAAALRESIEATSATDEPRRQQTSRGAPLPRGRQRKGWKHPRPKISPPAARRCSTVSGAGGAGLEGVGGDGIRFSSGPSAPAALDRLPGR
jgi:cyclic beta-1,2-glucan synthetase